MKKGNNKLQSFLNETPCAFGVILLISYIIITILFNIFSTVQNFFPIFPTNISKNVDTECKMIKLLSFNVSSRKASILFTVDSSLRFAPDNAYRLLRIQLQGPYGKEEMRYFDSSINNNFLINSTNITNIEFHLNQEGKNIINLMCLDTLLETITVNVEKSELDEGYTVFSSNPNLIENLCIINGSEIYSTQSKFISNNNNSYLSYHGPIFDFNSQSEFLFSGFLLNNNSLTNITPTSLILKIILPTYLHSKKNQVIHYFSNNFLIQHLINISSNGKFKNGISKNSSVCWRYLEKQIYPENEDFSSLSNDELQRFFSKFYSQKNKRSDVVGVYLPSLLINSEFYKVIPNYQNLSVFSQISIQDCINNFSQINYYIGEDNELLGSAFFMAKDSPIVIIIPPWKSEDNLSPIAKILMRSRKKIFILKGEMRNLDEFSKQERECLNDSQNNNCQSILSKIKYTIDADKLKDLFPN